MEGGLETVSFGKSLGGSRCCHWHPAIGSTQCHGDCLSLDIRVFDYTLADKLANELSFKPRKRVSVSISTVDYTS